MFSLERCYFIQHSFDWSYSVLRKNTKKKWLHIMFISVSNYCLPAYQETQTLYLFVPINKDSCDYTISYQKHQTHELINHSRWNPLTLYNKTRLICVKMLTNYHSVHAPQKSNRVCMCVWRLIILETDWWISFQREYRFVRLGNM